MLAALLPMLFATVPADSDVIGDRVDVIEVNHFFDDAARHVFDQVIFYDWVPHRCQLIVRSWRMLKCDGHKPRFDHQRGDFVCRWEDAILIKPGIYKYNEPPVLPVYAHVVREVRAEILRESWEQYDRELINRELVPKEHRRWLTDETFVRRPWKVGALNGR
jgi:hypothetical protein